MKITCLIDNCALDGFRAQHGLSFWIEACGRRILFDTGADGAFIENAARLGIDIAQAEFCVISHGHYDHGGGMAAFMAANDHARVYLRKGAFGRRYANKPGQDLEYIGLDAALAGSGRIVETDELTELCPGITLFSGVTGSELHSPANDVLTGEDPQVPDTFEHEQNMIIDENGVRVLMAGCAHKGVVNIINRFFNIESAPPAAVIGGFHLAIPGTGDVNLPLVDGTAERLLAVPGAVYYTGHCTGLPSYERLKEKMGDRVRYIHAGDTVEI